MSIVVLKKKSRRFKANISGVGTQGFSLNGGHRNSGSVGPTNLARSITRTPFRGTEPKGHGGCCGSYVVNISNSGECCTNDSGIIKRSNRNTKGLISSTITYPTSVYNLSCTDNKCQNNWTKDTSPLNYSQGNYIKTVIGRAARCDTEDRTAIPDAGIKTCDKNCDVDLYSIGGKKYMRQFYAKRVPVAVSSSEYMRTTLLKNNCLPTPPEKQPFPMTLNHNKSGCSVNYLTPEEARDAGQLPSNWVGFR